MGYSPHHSPVSELVTTIERYGIVTNGRPSKVVSDSLRREVFKGRVKRVGRGQYVFAGAPESTMRRIRRYARMHLGHEL